ncbi:hypothetical protein ES703_99248 [subsurface metagenome]
MNEEELQLRKQLRRFRGFATSLQWLPEADEALYAIAPVYQAEAIIKGMGYKAAAILFVTTLLVKGELELKDEVCLNCGVTITKEEQRQQKTEKAERILKQIFDPVAVTRKVTMPLVKSWLEAIECQMVEQGYRLPKWGRPQWLRVMEGKEAKE